MKTKSRLKALSILCFLSSQPLFAQDPSFEWAKQMGGDSTDYGYSITVDANGNIYSTGSFQDTVDFNPGTEAAMFTSAGYSDIFIQKLDGDGNFLWAKQMGGIEFDQGKSIAVDASGNIYTLGNFSGTVDFDPGAGTANLTSDGSWSDIFILKLDANGNFLWVKHMGGNLYDTGRSITVDSSGNVYTTGSFLNTVDFDPGTSTALLTSAGWADIFVQKLDSDGNFLWVKQMGGTHPDFGQEIAEELSKEVKWRFSKYMPTILDLITFMCINHEAMHLSQLAAWRRAMKLPSALATL